MEVQDIKDALWNAHEYLGTPDSDDLVRMYDLIDRLNVMQDVADFVRKTYPGATFEDHLRKAAHELEEIKTATTSDELQMEVTDVAFVCVAMSVGLGFSLSAKLKEKLEINRSRKWRRNPDGTYSHVKE